MTAADHANTAAMITYLTVIVILLSGVLAVLMLDRYDATHQPVCRESLAGPGVAEILVDNGVISTADARKHTYTLCVRRQA